MVSGPNVFPTLVQNSCLLRGPLLCIQLFSVGVFDRIRYTVIVPYELHKGIDGGCTDCLKSAITEGTNMVGFCANAVGISAYSIL